MKVISPMIELIGPELRALDACAGSATPCRRSATTWRAR